MNVILIYLKNNHYYNTVDVVYCNLTCTESYLCAFFFVFSMGCLTTPANIFGST